MMEQPAEFNRLLIGFLNTLPEALSLAPSALLRTPTGTVILAMRAVITLVGAEPRR